jgi:hypothetical protein
MATATRPRNKDRIFKKILATFIGEHEADQSAGALTIGRAKSKVWVCAGVPSGAIPSGMVAYDLILDTTNDDVYRFISGTTYVQMNATS